MEAQDGASCLPPKAKVNQDRYLRNLPPCRPCRAESSSVELQKNVMLSIHNAHGTVEFTIRGTPWRVDPALITVSLRARSI